MIRRCNAAKNEMESMLQFAQAYTPILSASDELVPLAARQMIEKGLEAELEEYIDRKKYELQSENSKNLYRNGHAKERNVTLSCDSFPVRLPQFSGTA